MATVVIPVYNNEKGIRNTLMSLQCYLPHDQKTEVIVSDDGSTDNTANVAESIITEDHVNLKVLRNKHGGPAVARNVGWKAASSDIVIFLDSDCQITKDWLNEMVSPFSEDDVIAVQGIYENSCPENWVSEYIRSARIT